MLFSVFQSKKAGFFLNSNKNKTGPTLERTDAPEIRSGKGLLYDICGCFTGRAEPYPLSVKPIVIIFTVSQR